MPSKWTFECIPIRRFVYRIVGNGKGWADPFAGMHSPAELTNDLNPKCNAKYHLEALEFCNILKEKNIELDGCIFDPPYSMEQVSRSYLDFGIKDWQSQNKAGKSAGFRKVKDKIAELILLNGIVISFGWNTVGMGKKRGFEIDEILIVCHGACHNDTLITIEKKTTNRLKGFFKNI